MCAAISENARTWKGDDSVIGEALRAYKKNPRKYLLLLASRLYSFRDNPEYAKWLIGLRSELWRDREELITPLNDGFYGTWWADRIDMLSTYLTWISEQKKFLPDGTRAELREFATHACETAIFGHWQLPKIGNNAHTYFLIYLTFVDLLGAGEGARKHLRHITEGPFTQIPNRNQRARVFIRLGMMLRREAGFDRSYRTQGFGWGIRGGLVRGISLRSRAKAFGALVGIKR